jgi:hypothetical protein
MRTSTLEIKFPASLKMHLMPKKRIARKKTMMKNNMKMMNKIQNHLNLPRGRSDDSFAHDTIARENILET